jgi:hypothetical protein
MSHSFSAHADVELLSAYLDRELVEPEARELEAHLEECEECHGRLDGLRRVTADLRRIEEVEPPPELAQAVARRIALATDDRESLLDRFEDRISIFNRQSSLLAMFGVIIALAIFMYLFSVALEQSRSDGLIPVIFEDPPGASETAERLEVAGRVLIRDHGRWLEDGVDAGAAARPVDLDSDAGRELLADHPELADLADLDAPAVVEVDGRVVEVRPVSDPR